MRLPIPPLRQTESTSKKMAPRVGLEPTAYRLTAGCSTIELSRNACYQQPLLFVTTSYIIHAQPDSVNIFFVSSPHMGGFSVKISDAVYSVVFSLYNSM